MLHITILLEVLCSGSIILKKKPCVQYHMPETVNVTEKTPENQKKDLLFGVGYGTLFERMEEGLFFMPKNEAASQAAR